MGLDIYVEDSDETYNVSDIHRLITQIPSYLPDTKYSFDYLKKIACEDEALLDPIEILDEVNILKTLLENEKRPYIFFDNELSWFSGIRFHPKPCNPYAQVVFQLYKGKIDNETKLRIHTEEYFQNSVLDYSNLIENTKSFFKRLHSHYVEKPVTLIASRNNLHLVAVNQYELDLEIIWDQYEYVSANVFEWKDNFLYADGKRLDDIPIYFKKNDFLLEREELSEISIFRAWQEELDELVRACNDAIKNQKYLRISL